MVNSEDLATQAFAITIGLVGISCLVVGGRLFARLRNNNYVISHEIGIAAALFFGIIFTVLLCLLSKQAVVDKTAGIVSEKLHKFSISSLFFYKIASALAKVTIVLQYLRYFTGRWTKAACINCLVLLPMGVLLGLVMVSFKCDPLIHQTPEKLGRCYDFQAFWIFDGSYDTALTLLVSFLPIPSMVSSQTPNWKIIDITVITLFGAIMSGATTVRLVSIIPRADLKEDVDALLIYHTWSAIDANVAMLSACLPTLRLLIREMLGTPCGLFKSWPVADTEQGTELPVRVDPGRVDVTMARRPDDSDGERGLVCPPPRVESDEIPEGMQAPDASYGIPGSPNSPGPPPLMPAQPYDPERRYLYVAVGSTILRVPREYDPLTDRPLPEFALINVTPALVRELQRNPRLYVTGPYPAGYLRRYLDEESLRRDNRRMPGSFTISPFDLSRLSWPWMNVDGEEYE